MGIVGKGTIFCITKAVLFLLLYREHSLLKNAQAVVSHVITSYSIHYTKLYETDEEAAMQFDFNKEYITEARQSITMDVPVSTIVARSDTAARGIVDSIRDHQTNMVVLGWKGYTEKQSYEMGNTLDRVIETAPCNIMIIKPGEEGLHRITSYNVCYTKLLRSFSRSIFMRLSDH